MFDITYNSVKKAIISKGYTFYADPRGYDLNIFGVRTQDMNSNKFNDIIGVLYTLDDSEICFSFPATTDPGLYWRENPMNVNGTALLKPGQYVSAFKLGQHKVLPALIQAKEVTVYRDINRDDKIDVDEDTVQTGMFGIDIHRASNHHASLLVNKWSAGCQVIQDPIHMEFLLELARESEAIYGNSFTYTLLEESDFLQSDS